MYTYMYILVGGVVHGAVCGDGVCIYEYISILICIHTLIGGVVHGAVCGDSVGVRLGSHHGLGFTTALPRRLVSAGHAAGARVPMVCVCTTAYIYYSARAAAGVRWPCGRSACTHGVCMYVYIYIYTHTHTYYIYRAGIYVAAAALNHVGCPYLIYISGADHACQ